MCFGTPFVVLEYRSTGSSGEKKDTLVFSCYFCKLSTMKSTTLRKIFGELTPVETKHAPQKLYYAGDIGLLTKGRKVSVVGSRKVSENGQKRAEAISKILVEKGFVVVSGLAEGVDTLAHTTAINQGGDTIAVIGTPLDQVFPKKNATLQATIQRDYLCISQFAQGYPSLPKNFVIRNRTMALVSDATIIVEAGERSGTRHLGWEALRLGRQVLLMENLITDQGLTWPKQMLDYGAQILTRGNIDELLEQVSSLTTGEDATF